MLNRSLILLAAMLAFCPLSDAQAAAQRSQTVVHINGTKYYIHTVERGETLYSLAKLYGVSEQEILSHNAAAASGLQTGQTLKIPILTVQTPVEALSEKKLRRTFDLHTVQPGETLYAISRHYGISVALIVEDNPEIDPARLSVGAELLIRKKKIGKTDPEQNEAEWEAYRDELNRVADEGTAYHIVQPGETVYALARRFEVGEAELCRLNDLRPEELRAGAIIRVPAPVAAEDETPAVQDTVAGGRTFSGRSAQPIEVIFRALSPNDTLRIALLLPLSSNKRESNINYLEFYQGFLLGLRSVKLQYGHTMRVDLYDTNHDRQKISRIIQSEPFRKADLIVGPIYEDELPEIIAYAERNAVPVISPLAQIGSTDSDILFQLAPDPICKYDKTADLLGGKKITLIHTDRNDKEFEREILELLGQRPYERYRYVFTHPSESEGENAGDLTPLLENGEDNLLIVTADNEVDVDRILASIASANTNLVARGRTTPRFTVLGNVRWNRYVNLDRSIFFKDKVVLFSTYHAKRDSEVIKNFDSEYIKAFGSLPTLYSYRGYDVALIFAPAMYADIEYDMEGRRYTPLQTTYVFRQPEGRSIHVNRNWMRVNYKPDFSITLE